MKIFRSRKVPMPRRGTKQSGGIDFFVPDDFPETLIEPNCSVNIPSGVHVKIPDNYILLGLNKSGVAANKHLLVGAQVVDSDYTGEVHLNLHNVGTDSVIVRPGDKVVQFVLVPVSLVDVTEVDTMDKLHPTPTERGTGAFGSTGTTADA